MLTFEFSVDGECPIDGKEYIEKDKVLLDDRGCFPYKNEEEFRLIIKEMGKVAFSQGDKIFKKIESNRIEDDTMLQMQKELFECHKELAESESKLLKIENQSSIRNIEKLCKRLEDINKSMFFAEAKQELIAISVIYGEMFCEVINGNWLYNADSKKCVVEGCGTGTYPLNDVIAACVPETTNYYVNGICM